MEPVQLLNLNLVRGDGRIGAAAGNRVAIDGRGRIVRTPIDRDARKVFLVDEVGIHEEIVDLLPEDVEMAPPPDSRTAAPS